MKFSIRTTVILFVIALSIIAVAYWAINVTAIIWSVINLESKFLIEDLILNGTRLAELGQYNQSIAVFDKALSIDPDSLPALHRKGTALLNLGQYNQSIAVFDKALSIDPNFLQVLHRKGTALLGMDRYNESIEVLDEALLVDANYTPAIKTKELALAALGKK